MKVAEFLLGSLPLLIQFYADLYRKIDFENTMHELISEFNVPKIKTYDFIIVGGGSAGCLLAGRLSEIFNVLLLEAGGTPPPATAVPYYTRAVNQDLSINNFFRTVPQTNASLSNGGIVISHTGRMLGGSSSHNEMMHNRGSPKDYDNWATLLNDDSFNYTNVLKYFKKMETFVGQTFRDDEDEYYGKDGPIVVDTQTPPILKVWFDAAKELGHDTGDPNGYQREGFAPLNVAVRRGQRSNSYVEYIKPYERLRKSLTVIRYANVLEILLDAEKKAYGVAYSRHGFPQIAHAHKEIILSAGAYSSPLLLMKSGIGPESTLNAAEIPVKVPLEAVGKNLGDHPLLYITDFSANDTSLFPKITSTDMEKIFDEYHKGDGVLSKVSQGPLCFIASTKATSIWPDLWIQISPQVSVDGEGESINFFNILGRPQSKGVLSLNTEKYKAGVRDDVELALIDNKLLTHPDDMDAFLEGIKFIFRIAQTEAFRSVNLTYTAPPDLACSAFTYLSDDYWKCFVQQHTQSIYHQVGTCSLGPDSGNSTVSVVDTKFRVRGVSSLRIVDSSVIPEVTNANLNAPVMMLAEKAADEIITFYQVPETTNIVSSPVSASTSSIISTTPSKSTSNLVEANILVLVSIFTFIVKLWVLSPN